MGKIEIFDKNSKIIAKSNDLYLVTNNANATIDDNYELAAILDSAGKYYTKSLPINYFTRDAESGWEPVAGNYSDYIRITSSNISKDGLIGVAIGDALGVPVEFMDRKDVQKVNLTDMIGKDDNFITFSRWGDFAPSGAWSDDTSMTVAAMDTIVRDNGQINYDNIMRSFISWWNEGKYCSLDEPFGLGCIISQSLTNYQNGVPALECGGKDIRDNGNGALMRILPFSLYAIEMGMNEEEIVDFIGKASAITHGHDISKMSCFIYTEFLKYLIVTKNPKIAYQQLLSINYEKYYSKEAIDAHARLLMANFLLINDDDIPENNGYVVVTLESAIHSLLSTDNFEDALLKSINLGYDTDTVGAVTGGLAGVLYGYKEIPNRWKNKLKKREELEKLSESFELILNNLQKKNVNKKK